MRHIHGLQRETGSGIGPRARSKLDDQGQKVTNTKDIGPPRKNQRNDIPRHSEMT